MTSDPRPIDDEDAVQFLREHAEGIDLFGAPPPAEPQEDACPWQVRVCGDVLAEAIIATERLRAIADQLAAAARVRDRVRKETVANIGSQTRTIVNELVALCGELESFQQDLSARGG